MRDTEIENKYLVKELPLGFENCAHKEIEQSYIHLTDEVDIRVRREEIFGENKYFLTVKINVGESYLVRKETETEIKKELYDKLILKKVEGTNKIEKTRYLYPIGSGLIAEIDIFHGALEGLQLVEVEFDSLYILDFFTEPIWFGENVTNDPTYKNKNLSSMHFDDNVRKLSK